MSKDAALTGTLGSAEPLETKVDRRTVSICGTAMHPLTMSQAVRAVETAIEAGRTLSIGVVNAAKLVNMQRNPDLRESVSTSDLVLADGAPLVWLSRLKGTPLPQRVAGIDLMFSLFRLADRRGYRVYLLGAEAQTLERVVETAHRDYPGMVIAGHRDGYFTPAQEPEIAEAVRAARVHLLFVAMTSPKKEIFMKQWGGRMGALVTHGVGGSFDVMAGVTRRAPRWMQRAGLEWFYRVVQEPRRMWRRYLATNVLFVGLALRDLLGRVK